MIISGTSVTAAKAKEDTGANAEPEPVADGDAETEAEAEAEAEADAESEAEAVDRTALCEELVVALTPLRLFDSPLLIPWTLRMWRVRSLLKPKRAEQT